VISSIPLYEDVTIGIPLGCSLSPLMGALYLKPVDAAMADTGLFKTRLKDDWVLLAPTRWKFLTSIRRVNEALAELKVEQHPDKTFIGRISRGFDFLGYRFTSAGLVGLARPSVERFVERATQLYERGADVAGASTGASVERQNMRKPAGSGERWRNAESPAGRSNARNGRTANP
jgi:RNA-directed DNA polymerase